MLKLRRLTPLFILTVALLFVTYSFIQISSIQAAWKDVLQTKSAQLESVPLESNKQYLKIRPVSMPTISSETQLEASFCANIGDLAECYVLPLDRIPRCVSEYISCNEPSSPTTLFVGGNNAQTGTAGTEVRIRSKKPHFSAIYNDTFSRDRAVAYHIQVDDDMDFSSPIWDSGDHKWKRAERLGGLGTDMSYDVAVNDNNMFVVTGFVDGSADLNGDGDYDDAFEQQAYPHGDRDVVLTAYSNLSKQAWYKRIGGMGSDAGETVYIDNDTVIVVGSVAGSADLNGDGDMSDPYETGGNYLDGFISVFNIDGTHRWSKRVGSIYNDIIADVAVDSANDRIIIAGYFGNDVDLNEDGDMNDPYERGLGSYDALGIVYSDSGQFEWGVRLGDDGLDHAMGVAIDKKNNYVFVGDVKEDADLNGDGDMNDENESGAGYGGMDCFISIFSKEGKFIWSERLGGYASDYCEGVVVTEMNDYAVAGITYSASDFNGDGDTLDPDEHPLAGYTRFDSFVSVFNASFKHSWAERIGGDNNEYTYDIATDNHSNIYLVGVVEGDTDLNGDGDKLDENEDFADYDGLDAFLTVFSRKGVHQWSERIGGIDDDVAYGVAVSPQNNVYVTAYVEGNADLNGDADSDDGGAEDGTGYADRDIVVTSFSWGATAMSEVSEGDRCQDIVYAGDTLQGMTEYFYRIAFFDKELHAGLWSTELSSFNIGIIDPIINPGTISNRILNEKF